MGTLSIDGREFEYQWASDAAYDGVRLEVLAAGGTTLFDVSVPRRGPVTANTFSNDVAVDLIAAAANIARRRR